jgi:asparagine synthase (glutamine-hydrolysing)
MEADVPLGAFLSGGIDSSIVVALMQAQSTQPIKTFTIGSADAHINEAVFAKAVAAHLGTEHTELYVGPREALEVVPLLPGLFDEPFSDSSQIPTFLLSVLARKRVTVALSGDGGDELFAGYRRYFRAQRVWNATTCVPSAYRTHAERAIRMLGRFCRGTRSFGPAGHVTQRFDRVARLVAARTPEQVYTDFTAIWADPSAVAIGMPIAETCTHSFFPDLMRTMMYMDSVTYLPEDILVKLDRASMGASLETRVPLLDPRVFEFAWSLPMKMKVGRFQGKRILRQVLARYVPAKLFDRPKRGFAIPISSWLRGPLRVWVEEMFSEDRLKRDGFLNPRVVRQYWEEHKSGRANWQDRLWNLLVFQAWLAAR